jgi:alpha-beta hydrolase superfamily lysophospholipase
MDCVYDGEDPALAGRLTTILGDDTNGRPPTLEPEQFDVAVGGVRLRAYSWALHAPERPTATCVLCHGFNHYAGSQTFSRLASELTAAGFACIAITVEGHGRSAGLPGLLPPFDSLVEQQLAFLDLMTSGSSPARPSSKAPAAIEWAPTSAVRPSFLVLPEGAKLKALPPIERSSTRAPARRLPSELPVVLLGESMGAAIALSMMKQRPGFFAGAALLSPMCGIDKAMMPPAWIISTLECVAQCLPWAPLAPVGSLVHNALREDLKRDAVASDNVRYAGRMRLGSAVGIRDSANAVFDAASSIVDPIIMFHAPTDRVTSAAASREFFERCASTDKAYVRITGGWHALWWEHLRTREAILTDVVDFFRSRASGRFSRDVVVDGPDEPSPVRVRVGEVFSSRKPGEFPPGHLSVDERPSAREEA